MTQCPDRDCREELVRLINEAEDLAKEAKTCAKDKIPKKWLWVFLSVFGLSIMTTGFNVYHEVLGASDKFPTKGEFGKVSEKVAVLESKYPICEKNLEEVKNDVKELQKQQMDNYLNLMETLRKIERRVR